MFKENFKWTWKHKLAFLKVEKELLGKNTLRGYLHDADKLFLYLIFSKKRTHKIHRAYAKHHIKNAITEKDVTQMVIDWECGRFTKPNKPMNAYETLMSKYPNYREKVLPVIQRLKLHN